jgi:hypothetical protein
MQGSFSGSIRQYFTIAATTSYYKSITPQNLFSDYYASLATQFAEVRINSIRLYYTPEASTSTNGQYAAALIDTTANNAATLDYGQVLSLPGSTARKVYQSCGLHWKWTEPSDAEFVRSNSAQSICDLFLSSNTTAKNISGEIVCDASVIMRTLPSAFSCHLLRMLHSFEFTTEQYSQAFDFISEKLSSVPESTSELDMEDLQM